MRRIVSLLALFGLLLIGLSVSAAQDRPADSVPLQVISTDPAQGADLPLTLPITVDFNLPLDCDTVAEAASIQPSTPGEFVCRGSSVSFNPAETYATSTLYTVEFSTALTAAEGTALQDTVSLSFFTAGDLLVSSTLPTNGSSEVRTDTTLTVVFNRPVVPLTTVSGAADAPNPIRIQPAIEGTGEWLNTSIYTFTPDTAWAGGTTYTVTVADVTAIDGAALSAPVSFSFTTVSPAVLETMPANDATDIRLEPMLQLTFNQPVDRASLEANFFLRVQGTSASIPGSFTWADDSTGVAFEPDTRLQHSTVYEYGFPGDAVFAASGQAALQFFSANFRTVPLPAITDTFPSDNLTGVQTFSNVTIFFASPMNPETFEGRITIDPQPATEPELFYRDWNNSLAVTFPLEPSTDYTVTVEPGMEDIYGNVIETSRSFSFSTLGYAPSVELQVAGGNVSYLSAYRETTALYLTHRNVDAVNLELYRSNLDTFLAEATDVENSFQLGRVTPLEAQLLRQWQIESVAPENVLRYELLDLGSVGPNDSVSEVPPCAGAMPARVGVGDQGRVITDPDPLRARTAPPDGEVIDQLYRDYAFTVIGGPVCANGIYWWEITLRQPGVTAWVAEGLNDEYFIETTIAAQRTPVEVPADVLDGGALPTGIYHLTASAPDPNPIPGDNPQGLVSNQMLIVSTASLNTKIAIDEVVVWATDLQSGQPLPNQPISVYVQGQAPLTGVTDASGVATIAYPRLDDLYRPLVAVLDNDENFGIGYTSWDEGIQVWRFDGLASDFYPRRYQLYMYTERPVYRPGQTVYFRGVLREKDDMTFDLAELDTVTAQIFDDTGTLISEQPVSLTPFGTFSGQFEIAEDAGLGFYRVSVDLPSTARFSSEGGAVIFNVAEYRLPEYQVEVTAAEEEVLQGETVPVAIDASFFFGGPVIDAEVQYTIYRRPYVFEYDGPGRYDFYDFNYDDERDRDVFFDPFYGRFVESGTGRTSDDGLLLVDIAADLADSPQSHIYMLEATVTDETGFSVTSRDEFIVHRGLIYLGARPQEYVGRVDEPTTIEIVAADWDSEPVAGQTVEVEVVERRWSSIQSLDRVTGRAVYEFEVEEIPISTGTVTTGDDGRTTFDFVPPNGGIFKTYVRSTDSQGNPIVASTTQWVSGREYVAWRTGNDSRIELIADSDSYEIGDTAQILIASPFQGSAEALVTVERGGVLTYDRVTLESNSFVYELPIVEDYAPNVFVSVFIVKGVDENNPVADYRMGILGFEVDRSRKELYIDISTDAESTGPRETISYTVTTTDYTGAPVQAELGLALVDLAALSLAPRQEQPILDFFYGLQALSVRTTTPLTINTDLVTQFVRDVIKGGGGGGGGGGVFEIREEFVETPFWEGALVTGEDGTATFDVTLPDNLTTWRLTARGVTAPADGNMLVGQAETDIISTKPLIVRPVTPRFAVVGDEIVLAAVVNNNSRIDLEVEVGLMGDAEGRPVQGLDLSTEALQMVSIAAGRSARVEFPVTVGDVESLELIFTAQSSDGQFTDAARPQIAGPDGVLPVLRYEAPEITGTGGLVAAGESRTEAVALPARFDVTQGDLTIQAEQSLAATSINSLDVIENAVSRSTEVTVSRFLPNAVTARALRELGLENPELLAQLDTEVNLALQRLAADQKVDGGWGWFLRDNSDPLTTAYALLGLLEASEAGYAVEPEVVLDALGYLQNNYPALLPGVPPQSTLNRQAFVTYVLSRAGAADPARISSLYERRANLSIYAQALLALALPQSDSTRVNQLMDDIFAQAIVSANGVHWEEERRDPFNWNSNIRTTAIVLNAVAQLRPESDLAPNIVRWLMVARDGDSWSTTQETAWSVMGLSRWMLATGELQPNYDYLVTLNGETLIEGSASPDSVFDVERAEIPVSDLQADDANLLRFALPTGDAGRLYYTAYLRAFLPVSEIEPLDRGVIVSRRYLDPATGEPITEAEVGELVDVNLTIIAPNDLYFAVIEDPLPAGAEGVNPNLLTEAQVGTRPGLVNDDGLSFGWGWWWFSDIEFRDEQVVISSSYLPAGTYEYVYSIRAAVPGTYNVIPPTAREFYFPEVFGRGAGSQFTVLPAAELATAE